MFYIIGFLIVGLLLSLSSFSKNTNKKQIQLQMIEQNKLAKLIDDNVKVRSKQYVNQEFSKAIILDEENNKIHLFNISSNNCRTYNFDDVIESEIIIDNCTITKTNRGKQAVGALIGAGIAGVGGLLLGGLTSEQISTEKIKNVQLNLTLKDMDNPKFKISFLSPIENSFYSKDSPQVRNALNAVDNWHGYFSVILNQQNKAI